MKLRAFRPPSEKRCIYCEIVKPRCEYHEHKYTTKIGREGVRLNSACRKCHGLKTYHQKLKNPEKTAAVRKAYLHKNKDRIVKKIKEDRAKNPGKWQNYALKRQYGISLEEYSKMEAEQCSLCKICGCLPVKVGHKRRLHVDHCHATGRIRGLLCHNCNVAIGLVKDSPDVIRSMLAYLGC